jgi:hypothetical protein
MELIEVSYTQISEYGDPDLPDNDPVNLFSCRRKWASRKIFNLFAAPSEHLLKGKSVHETFQKDLTLVRQGGNGGSYNTLVGWYEEILAKERKNDDPLGAYSQADYTRLLESGRTIMRSYKDSIQQRFLKPTRIVAIEEVVEFKITAGSLNVHFRGRLDVATKNWLFDFKTGKLWPYAAEYLSTQVEAYLLGVREHKNLLLRPLDKFMFLVFTDEGEIQILPTQRTEEALEAYRTKIYRIGSHMLQSIRLSEFTAQPGSKCKWCSYLGQCAEGMHYIKQYNLEPKVPVITSEDVTYARNTGALPSNPECDKPCKDD